LVPPFLKLRFPGQGLVKKSNRSESLGTGSPAPEKDSVVGQAFAVVHLCSLRESLSDFGAMSRVFGHGSEKGDKGKKDRTGGLLPE